MNAQSFGAISGVLVFLSAVPYIVNTIRGKIVLHAVSWTLWLIIGFALLVTYKSSGAKDSLWAAFSGFINPLLIVGIILFRQYKKGKKFDYRELKILWKNLERSEKACVVFGIISLIILIAVRGNKNLAQLALYIAIIADACAAVPTIKMIWKDPKADKPGAWAIFALGYVFALPAVTEQTLANYALPVYMIAISGAIALLTAIHRVKTRAPIQEWI